MPNQSACDAEKSLSYLLQESIEKHVSKTANDIFKVENAKGRPVILMTGYIGGWRVNADNLYEAIKKLEKDGVTECDMLINSGGGSTVDGLTIGEFLQASKIKFNGIVTGMAASMAGVILQFCDTRASYKYGRLMTHKVQGGVRGEAEQIRAYADFVEQEEEKIVNKFIERTGKEKKTVSKWMASGVMRWFNAEKAKAANLIDKIIDTAKPAPDVAENASVEDMVNSFDTVFNSVVEEYLGEDNPAPAPTNYNPDTTNMKTRILTMLGTAGMANGLTENASDEAVFAELQNIINAAKNEQTAVNELKAFKEAQATAAVKAAAKAGKIAANEVEEWTENYIQNPKAIAAALERMTGKVDPNAGLQRQVNDPSAADTPEALKGREDWNHEKWMEEDPKGYQKLADEHPEAYDKIFKAHFNTEA